MRFYLGLATTFHDPALALVGPDGTLLFAEAAERFLQYKRAPNCEPDAPARMASLLKDHVPPGSELVVASTWGPQFTEFPRGQAGAGAFDLMALAAHTTALNRSFVPEQAERVFIADLHGAQERAGHGTLLALNQEARITGAPPRATIAGQRRYPHHLCHAAYGLWGSPFDDATALVVDGMGETGAAAIYRLEAGRVTELRRHRGRGSLGFLYGLITDLAGFDQVKGEEWKIMGLAPYGQPDPDLAALLGRLCTVEGHRLRYADAETIRAVAAEIRARRPADALETGWADLARCGQDLFGTLMDALVAEAHALAPSDNLVIAGGCGLNSSYNGRVLGRSGFTRLHVPSAPADDGNAVGAAWLAYAEDHPDWAGPPPERDDPTLSRPAPEPALSLVVLVLDGGRGNHQIIGRQCRTGRTDIGDVGAYEIGNDLPAVIGAHEVDRPAASRRELKARRIEIRVIRGGHFGNIQRHIGEGTVLPHIDVEF